MTRLTWWTPFTYLAPSRYLSTGEFWRDFDIEHWSETFYDWTPDEWNGLRDFAKPPDRTVEEAEGDCEDYALVAASWAVANDRTGVGLAFCIGPKPWPTHVVAYDADRVYSSGVITEQSLESFLDRTKYSRTLRRRIT